MTEEPTEPPMKDENVNESVRHKLDFCASRAARQGADFENNPFAEVSEGVSSHPQFPRCNPVGNLCKSLLNKESGEML
jgi:hypothetical protein